MNELQTDPKNTVLFVIPGRASSRERGIQYHTLLWIPGSRQRTALCATRWRAPE
jgi:hypothetical protein